MRATKKQECRHCGHPLTLSNIKLHEASCAKIPKRKSIIQRDYVLSGYSTRGLARLYGISNNMMIQHIQRKQIVLDDKPKGKQICSVCKLLVDEGETLCQYCKEGV